MENPERNNKQSCCTVDLNNLIYIYRRGNLDVPALQGLTCKFYSGEISVVMGPSGCGKTTLLNIISGILTLNSGKASMKLNDQVFSLETMTVKQREKFRREHISYIFQTKNLIPFLTCYENALFPAIVAQKTINYEDEVYAPDSILTKLGLNERKAHFPSELSGGEQQRTCFAAALIKNADIILCDEPTGELDSISKMRIFDLIQMISKTFPQKTIIIVTHDHDFKGIADRVYNIKDGKIVNELIDEDLKMYKDHFAKAKSGSLPPGIDKISEEIDPAITELEELKFLITKKIEKKKNKD